MGKRDTCKHGHSLDDAYIYKNDYGKKVRKCATCHRARVKKAMARLRAADKAMLGKLTFDAGGRIIGGTV